jgi:hypothetical protein
MTASGQSWPNGSMTCADGSRQFADPLRWAPRFTPAPDPRRPRGQSDERGVGDEALAQETGQGGLRPLFQQRTEAVHSGIRDRRPPGTMEVLARHKTPADDHARCHAGRPR